MAASMYHNPSVRTSSTVTDLPKGQCNFRDLSTGVNGPICGCTHFWPNSGHLQGGGQDFERAWCFCGHHACFHSFSSPRVDIGLGVEHSREQTSADRKTPSELPMKVWTAEPRTPTASRPTGLGIQTEVPKETCSSASINARVWEALNAFARDQEIAQQPFGEPSLPSTAAASTTERGRRSPLSVMREQMQEQQRRTMGPPVNIPFSEHMSTMNREDYSATEVATPSIQGTPNIRAGSHFLSQTRNSPLNTRSSMRQSTAARTLQIDPVNGSVVHIPFEFELVQPVVAGATTSRSIKSPRPQERVSLHDMQTALRTLGQRLEALENMSFSHVPVEFVQDKFESVDGRLLDLEHWRVDREEAQMHVDQEMAEAEQIRSEQENQPREQKESSASSSASENSYDSRAAAYTEAAILATLAANSETAPCLAALESRIADLESSALPTHNQPWQLEVVVLPWGRDLRGIWFSSAESTQHSLGPSTQLSEEWAPVQSLPKISFKSAASAGWTTESIEAWAHETQEWLSPKACGPSGVVYQRLASRGLVQDVTLTSSDASHVLYALQKAFSSILGDVGAVETPLSERFLALSECIVPLRKVRKSTRLRFLSPAEMVTPALWTAAFLDASVCMKVNDGPRRVYVTTPEAYLQPPPGVEQWTWPRIRDLPLFDASGEERAVHANKVAIEACWSYHDRIDRPMSTKSFASTPESQWSTPSDGMTLGIAPQSAESSSASELNQLVVPKRRVVSADSGIAVLSSASSHAEPFVVKRRRLSDAPEAERRGLTFTPRWSREPPSPFTSEPTVDCRSQGVGSRKRGNTPFAYATPHSHNNQYPERVDLKLADGDTEAGTEDVGLQSVRGDDEWHGVGEEMVEDNSTAEQFSREGQDYFDDDDGNDGDEQGGVRNGGDLSDPSE